MTEPSGSTLLTSEIVIQDFGRLLKLMCVRKYLIAAGYKHSCNISLLIPSNANEPCSNQISLPFGFVSRCKQKYIKKKLLSLDPDGQGTSSENFFVPSCCVCEIVRVNSKKKK